MALSEKEVFYAMLRNRGTNLKALCEISGQFNIVPYHIEVQLEISHYLRESS